MPKPIHPAKSNLSQIYTTPHEKNKVRYILREALCPSKKLFTKLNLVGWNNVLLVGLMGSSKTKLINYLIDLVKANYSKEDRNIPFTDSMDYNIENMKDVFYNLLICDDAVELQDSYSSIGKASRKLSHKFFNIRHIIEERFKRSSGFVVTVWGVQMYKALQKRLRQAPLTFFTSTFNDKEENRFLYQTLDSYHYKFLSRKTNLIYLNNRYDYNRFCILKANTNIHFFEFDLPKSNMKRMVTAKLEAEERVFHFQKLLLKNGMAKSELFEILAYVFSDKRGKKVGRKEGNLIRKVHSFGLNKSLVAELFKRQPKTVTAHIEKTLDKYQKKGEKGY